MHKLWASLNRPGDDTFNLYGYITITARQNTNACGKFFQPTQVSIQPVEHGLLLMKTLQLLQDRGVRSSAAVPLASQLALHLQRLPSDGPLAPARACGKSDVALNDGVRFVSSNECRASLRLLPIPCPTLGSCRLSLRALQLPVECKSQCAKRGS